jgi:hypothetical protein
MKKLVLILVLITSSINALAQVDTARKEFFPLHIGNIWQYRDENNELAIQQVIGDTILEGERYFLLTHSLRTSGGRDNEDRYVAKSSKLWWIWK